MSHYIAEEDAEGWITCDCGLHYPSREKHAVHREIQRARDALKEAQTDGA